MRQREGFAQLQLCLPAGDLAFLLRLHSVVHTNV